MTPEQKKIVLYDEVARLLVRFRMETAIDPNPAHFELRVHPDDHVDWLRDERHQYTLTMPRDVMGIALVVDASVAQGHPVLRSTWEWVL